MACPVDVAGSMPFTHANFTNAEPGRFQIGRINRASSKTETVAREAQQSVQSRSVARWCNYHDLAPGFFAELLVVDEEYDAGRTTAGVDQP